MAKPGVMFYFDIRPCLKRLSTEEKGLLFEAILDYAEHGTEPDFDGVVGVAWDFIKPGIDRDSDRYGNQVLQKQYAAYVREAKKKGLTPLSFDDWKAVPDNERCRLVSADNERYPTTTSTPSTTPTTATTATIESKADKPPTRHRFVPPTVDEVRAYCAEKGYPIDPERFVDFYSSKGWMVGKNKMQDWRAAVRTWSRKEQATNGTTESEPLWTVGTTV